jgi:hypothetical protein
MRDIPQDGLADRRRQRIALRPAQLRPHHMQRLRDPVDVLQCQSLDLAAPQAIMDQQRQNRMTADSRPEKIVQRSNVSLNRLAGRPRCTLGPLLDHLVGGGQQRFRLPVRLRRENFRSQPAALAAGKIALRGRFDRADVRLRRPSPHRHHYARAHDIFDARGCEAQISYTNCDCLTLRLVVTIYNSITNFECFLFSGGL